MPELPEVETTCRGVRPHLEGMTIQRLTVHEPRLRWPVPDSLVSLQGQEILGLERRAKYLLMRCTSGYVIIHLGMSGSLRIATPDIPLRKHDHIVLELSSGKQLRYHDPRRFGCWLWAGDHPWEHPLLCDLGPEPLDDQFTGEYLHQHFRNRSLPIKQAIMDAKTVVGVGNIYACESLFLAGIHPLKPAGKISRKRLDLLVGAIREVLEKSIHQGGTTLRDFVREDGQPGYFRQQLRVYDRTGLPCLSCASPIHKVVIGQRSTFFCPRCQR